MTRQETIKILSILKAGYPNFYKSMTKDEAEGIIQLWATMFCDDDYLIVSEAIKSHIATDDKGYPPVIGQIKSKIRQLTHPNEMTELEAWNMVLKACTRSSYNSQEEFDKLPNNIKCLIGSPSVLKDWASVDLQQLNTVIQSNFMRSYKAHTESEKQWQSLPESVKNISKSISAKLDNELPNLPF